MSVISSQSLIYLALSYFVAISVTPVMVRIATRKGWVDQPGLRKVHLSPIPRLGGVGIFLAIWLAWFLFRDSQPLVLDPAPFRAFETLFGASALIFLLGIYDDIRGANAWQKLAVQFVAAAWVVSQGLQIKLVLNPFGGEELAVSSAALSWTLSLFWIVLVTNAINLIDGLDGLASGVCAITALSIFFISSEFGSLHIPVFAMCVAGACLGFLMFNFSPARIFLGDSGSLVLGFLLACLSLMGSTKRSTAIVMFGPPLILLLPLADTFMAIGRRFLRRVVLGEASAPAGGRSLVSRLKEVLQADQEHIHHGLLKIGLSHRSAVILLYAITTVLGISAYRVAVGNHLVGTFAVIGLLSLALYGLRRAAKRS